MPRPFTSKREKRVVEALTPNARYGMVPSTRLGITKANIDTTLTYVFDKFMDALRMMADEDNAETFRTRFKKNNVEINKLTLAIRKNSRKAIEGGPKG